MCTNVGSENEKSSEKEPTPQLQVFVSECAYNDRTVSFVAKNTAFVTVHTMFVLVGIATREKIPF